MELAVRRKYSFSQIIQLALLFMVSMNYRNLYFYIIFLACFVCLLVNLRCVKVDIVTILLVVLSTCYIVFYPATRDSYTTIIKQYAYPMCYLIGLNIFSANKSGNEKNIRPNEKLKVAIMVMAMGTLLHYLLNAAVNMGSLMRNTEDYWTGEVVSATEQALLAVMSLGVFNVWLVGDYSVWKKTLAALGLIAVLAYNFILAGRTILMLELVILCVAFLYSQKNMYTTGKIKSYLFLFVMVIGAVYLFWNNTWGVRDWIVDSNLGRRFDAQEAMADIRFDRKLMFISHMWEYPFGGGGLRESVGGYSHELYLDAYSDVGIVGYIVLAAVVIASVINVWKLINSNELDAKTKNMLLCVFLGINIVFFLEPVLQGAPWLFCIYCFLCGVVRRELRSINELSAGTGKIRADE